MSLCNIISTIPIISTILNIIIGSNVIPELFQAKVTPKNIFDIVDRYLTDDKLKNYQINYLKEAIKKMSSNNKNPHMLAVETIDKLINKKNN